MLRKQTILPIVAFCSCIALVSHAYAAVPDCEAAGAQCKKKVDENKSHWCTPFKKLFEANGHPVGNWYLSATETACKAGNSPTAEEKAIGCSKAIVECQKDLKK